jgi:hypothetical protein
MPKVITSRSILSPFLRVTTPFGTRLVVVGACVAPLLLSACVVSVDRHDGPMQRDEKRFHVTGVSDVSLVTFDGSVDVRGWDRDEVFVEIEKRAADKNQLNEIEVVSDQQGNQIRVEARRPADTKYGWGRFAGPSRSAKLIASVPMGSNVLVRSGDGNITVERVKGRLDLRTSDGDLNGIDLTGDVSARTGDGRVRLDGIDGICDVVTGDGNISISGRFDLLRARTSDGTLTLKAFPGSQLSDDWHLQTGDGNIVFYLPDAMNAEIEAEANDGAAKADSALALRVEADLPKRLLRGTLGTGGRLVRVSTGDGSIVFKRLPSAAKSPSMRALPEQPVERERPVDH